MSSHPSELNWNDEQDIVVAGFGGAGAAAALEARELGASVIALDKYQGGGATARSGGVVYLGGGTRYQKEAGFDDNADEMFKYLSQETADAVKPETLKRFCDQSLENMAWLEQQNVKFAGNVPPVKTSYPSDKYFLYYSGNEAVESYAEHARPAPRGHRVAGSGLSGPDLFAALKDSAVQKGVKLQLQSEVTRLVVNQNRDVLGVEVRRLLPGTSAARKHKRHDTLSARTALSLRAFSVKQRRKAEEILEQDGVIEYVRARKGIVLSTGGFIFNREMVASYGPKYTGGLPLGTGTCDGSGILLGQSAGGAIDRMDKISAWRFINPPMAWAQGIVVNDNGERYCNEEVYGARLGYEMCENHNGRGILIINRALRKEAMKQIMPGKAWSFQILPALLSMFMNSKKANTVAQLASVLEMPEGKLSETIRKYSAAARGETADDFGKSDKFLAPLDEGPWYAMDMSVDCSVFPCPVMTLGGLKVDEESGQVMKDDGQTIKGLYSAGRNAVGVASNLYLSGLSIADCIFSGRRAGRHAATISSVEESINHEKTPVSEPC